MKTEVKSDNELIAEFMGGVFYGPDDLDHPNKWWFNKQPHEGYRKDAHHLTVGLRYNIDWSWLMPVVEKIESLGYYTNIFKDEDGQQTAFLHPVPSYKRDESSMIVPNDPTRGNKSKIDTTYKAVVEFIHWYNNQTTSNPEQS